MQPNDNNQATNVWISREEYERLRQLENAATPQASSIQVDTEKKAINSQKKWQIVLGGLLSIGLYFSVVSGSGANIFLVAAIVIFGTVSLIDYMRSKQNEGIATGLPKRSFKHNPYKILVIGFVAIAVLPTFALFGFFFLMLALGGGDVGS